MSSSNFESGYYFALQHTFDITGDIFPVRTIVLGTVARERARPPVTHHTQQISKVAVVDDSKAILKCIISRNHKACSCTPLATGAAYAASGAWRA